MVGRVHDSGAQAARGGFGFCWKVSFPARICFMKSWLSRNSHGGPSSRLSSVCCRHADGEAFSHGADVPVITPVTAVHVPEPKQIG